MERKNYNAHHFTSAGDPGKYGKHRKNLCCYGNRSAFDRAAWLPEEILVAHEETCIRIPMEPAIRSLNLSNSVAIVLYEALRQQRFASMQLTGELHRLSWKTEE